MKNKKQYFANKENKDKNKEYYSKLFNGSVVKKSNNKNEMDMQEKNFKQKLYEIEYTLHIISRDGNCLFSSISDQMYGTDKHSAIIREKCMDFIEKNKLFYSQFIEGGESQMDAYIKRKRKDGIWGDNLEIQALSEIYNRPIEIYVNTDKPIRSFSNIDNNKKFPIKISYHGNKHYNSMVPTVKNPDFAKYKNELINTISPGIYEDKFIKNYDITKKLNQNFENINEPIEDQFENDINYENFDDDIYKNENPQNCDDNDYENIDDEFLSNPIVINALDLGFKLNEAIEAVKICGNNEELVMNYLCNKQEN